MVEFVLRFLGSYQVHADQTPVTDFHSDKVRALFAYLALEPRQFSRAELAALLWPEIGDQSARANLRTTLHRLRLTFDSVAPDSSSRLLTVTRQSIHFNPESASVDVHLFQAAVRDAQMSSSSVDPDRLATAVALYRGELLSGFGLADAPEFEEWLFLRRELLHQQALVVLHTLATAYETVGHYEQAHVAAGRLLALDAYREETHRQLMRLLTHMGQPNRALEQMEGLRRLLRKELGVDASAETLTLGQQIAAGEFGKASSDRMTTDSLRAFTPTPVRPVPLENALDLREIPMPGPFFGRDQERKQMAQWLLQDRCHVVAIVGIGGMGKSTLATQCIRDVAASPDGRFDALFWRSLVNAPPLNELLPPLLQALSQQQLRQIPESVDEQLRLLLDFLRDQRVLFVLDNMESILEPAKAGVYRRGYDRLERDGYAVRALALSGLDNEAGYQLLLQRSVLGNGDQYAKLVERYSGNPLALKLVADTVDDIFGGDIAGFLTEDTLIFEDIRAVLDQHFARLTDLEQQVLFWLAIEREVTALATLRSNLLMPPPQRVLLETLRNLQRHSLVERHEQGFTLQNVITEYLTDRLVSEAVTDIETGDLQSLHRFALLKAQAKEYVRQSQARLILRLIADQLQERLGFDVLQARLKQSIELLRTGAQRTPSYAGGNIFNLLVQLGVELSGYDFSRLHLWQAHLQGVSLWNVNFTDADLRGATFTQPFGTVPSTVISPDGRLFASGAESGTITVWQMNDFQPISILEGHTSNVSKLHFSPDGRRLASSSIDGTIRVWNWEVGQTDWVTESNQALVYCVAFSPDGRYLASGGSGSHIHLWDANTAELFCELAVEPNSVTRTVAFHPEGTMFGAANLGGHVYLWDIANLV